MKLLFTSAAAAVSFLISDGVVAAANATPSQALPYRFELVYIAESQPSEWLFVISGTGYRTLYALKCGIAGLPKPASVEFHRRGRRSPDEPLSSEAEVTALTQYAKSQNVEIIQIPSR